jgi:hypothetical protein
MVKMKFSAMRERYRATRTGARSPRAARSEPALDGTRQGPPGICAFGAGAVGGCRGEPVRCQPTQAAATNLRVPMRAGGHASERLRTAGLQQKPDFDAGCASATR